MSRNISINVSYTKMYRRNVPVYIHIPNTCMCHLCTDSPIETYTRNVRIFGVETFIIALLFYELCFMKVTPYDFRSVLAKSFLMFILFTIEIFSEGFDCAQVYRYVSSVFWRKMVGLRWTIN